MAFRKAAKGISMGLLIGALIVSFACKAPAKFDVVSLDVVPSEVKAGEAVTITAKITNVGGSEGTYTAVLMVDGIEVERKDITLPAGTTKTVSFTLAKDTPGTYKVAIGELMSSLVIKKKLVAKEVELKYDDGTARDSLSFWAGGHIVVFSPPATPFTVKKVRIAGGLYGTGLEDRKFDVEILDKELKVLHSATYSYTKFPARVTSWVGMEIPDIKVTDKFFVHVYTVSPRFGLHIGADDSVANEHSDVTVRTGEGAVTILAQWPYSRDFWFGDKSKVNWMIRVVGTYLAPEK